CRERLPAALDHQLPVGPGEDLQRLLPELSGAEGRDARASPEPVAAMRPDGPRHPARTRPARHPHGGANVTFEERDLPAPLAALLQIRMMNGMTQLSSSTPSRRPLLAFLKRRLQGWLQRHQLPFNFYIHLIGIPLAVAAIPLLFLFPWYWGVG